MTQEEISDIKFPACVHVYSRKQILELTPRGAVVISIAKLGERIDLSHWEDKVFYFDFDDIEERKAVLDPMLRPFNMEMAHQIWDIIQLHGDSEMDFIVHCAAGVSRSVAVGMFIAEETGRKLITHAIGTTDFANGHVLRLLHRIVWEGQ